MSRSLRHTPIFPITSATSEAWDKARWHRAWRRAERQRLGCRPFSEPLPERAFFNPWTMNKDGKHWRPATPLGHPVMRK
ncbi:hypothetical protein RRX38_06965 [Pseudomonas sp. DTU_2021_1001937_2_SI_NGA_ILE_001]|uniref:hypothetical protein n=1 Tax=Pseudomonas sp. DTU_2021_1001937_2_SI_NGA_ILE_001 TaxID=3077589 RepID=UPI0028FC2460|nr:hypothetical protein [Pseudomonas sp. DTU_2021_1001937_2_SI_NGA_ILE_001]WNW10904.1 hypothetical protein RRX38_06965 [Pseudomonas sp. DTU_2021_1001937_2_SI_NGA_ILE_001]